MEADMMLADRAITPLREALRLDGGDLALTGLTDGVLRLDLRVEGASCLECILPKEFLESLVLTRVGKVVPGIFAVEVFDPRVDEEAKVQAHESEAAATKEVP